MGLGKAQTLRATCQPTELDLRTTRPIQHLQRPPQVKINLVADSRQQEPHQQRQVIFPVGAAVERRLHRPPGSRVLTETHRE